MNISCSLHAPGICVPSQVVSNFDLSRIVDTNNEWIVERTGIRNRHKVEDNEETSTLGLTAARTTLSSAALEAPELTHVIAATCTPDHLSPSVACIIAGQLGAGPVMAFDFSAACAGYIYGLSIGRSLLATQPDAKILFICAEALTRRLNWKDRSTCVLFGDAAASCILSSSNAGSFCSIIDVICQSDGTQKNLIIVGGGTSCKYSLDDPVDENFFITMNGRDTYRFAVRHMVQICQEILERNNLSIEDIDLFVPHQANMRIIEAVGSRLKINPARVFTNVAEYGNTSAASIPLALSEAMAEGRIKQGQKVLVSAFGAGLTWGAALLQFS